MFISVCTWLEKSNKISPFSVFGYDTEPPKIVLFTRTILRQGAAVSSRGSREIGGPLPSPRRSGGMAKRKSRAAGSTLPRRSEKRGEPVDFRTAKWKTGRFGGLFHGEARKPSGLAGLSHGEAAKLGRRGTFARRSGVVSGAQSFARRSGEVGAPQPLRAYKRKEKPQAAKGDGTANFVTKGRRTCRRLVAGSSPKNTIVRN